MGVLRAGSPSPALHWASWGRPPHPVEAYPRPTTAQRHSSMSLWLCSSERLFLAWISVLWGGTIPSVPVQGEVSATREVSAGSAGAGLPLWVSEPLPVPGAQNLGLNLAASLLYQQAGQGDLLGPASPFSLVAWALCLLGS